MHLKPRIFLARPAVGDRELEAVREVFGSRFLTEGEKTREFERRLADYVGSKFCIASSSGTTALEMALRALRADRGEVVVPDFTHAATADAVISSGATPVLVDVGIPHGNIQPDALEPAFGPRTICVVPVSLFGNPLTYDIYEMCAEREVAVVEDAANSLGAELRGRHVGSIADVSCFSFHPRKIITTGEGGAITTDNEDVESFSRSFKTFGGNGGQFVMHGTNYKLPDILAAIGLVQLDRLDKLIRQRRERAHRYNDLLGGIEDIVTPSEPKEARPTYQSYTIYFERDGMRNKVMRALADQNIESQIGAHALHMHTAFISFKRVGDLKKSELLYKRLLALPLHYELADEDQDRICAIIRETSRAS